LQEALVIDFQSALISLADTYCAANRLSEARVANLVGCDGRFFIRIRSGKTCTFHTFERIVAWFSTNWPDGVAWPASAPRPRRDDLCASAEAIAEPEAA
jgi:hypothetical protein